MKIAYVELLLVVYSKKLTIQELKISSYQCIFCIVPYSLQHFRMVAKVSLVLGGIGGCIAIIFGD
jgi:hypothetical protein